jgi:hypothetical protein
MNANNFIDKWRKSTNYLNLPSVGIHVGWDIIPSDSKVEQLSGLDAWERMHKFTPSWFKKPKTFQQLIDSKDSDYQQIVKEETDNGKIEYYKVKGLKEPHFCAFANKDGTFVLLGDGNHRFLDCLHLIHEHKISLDSDSVNTTLDIIYLENFDEVMLPTNTWPNYGKYPEENMNKS